MQYSLHLERHGLAWPEIVLASEPSLEKQIHCFNWSKLEIRSECSWSNGECVL